MAANQYADWCKAGATIKSQSEKTAKRINKQYIDILPDPRGRKSLPTTLSRTDDFPELYINMNTKQYETNLNRKALKKIWNLSNTWPPTTATVGRASQRDMPSPPWSPNTVHALWILFTKPIKLSIVAISENVEKCSECWELGIGSQITLDHINESEREEREETGKTVEDVRAAGDVLTYIFIYTFLLKMLDLMLHFTILRWSNMNIQFYLVLYRLFRFNCELYLSFWIGMNYLKLINIIIRCIFDRISDCARCQCF